MNKFFRTLSLVLLLIILARDLLCAQSKSYSFIVAGHAYGSHTGGNIGLHPPFLESLNRNWDTTIQFLVFTGDVVNNSTKESWEQVENELKAFGLPFYFSMGNHDNNQIGYSVFKKHFGNDYYAFDFQRERYIVLNSTAEDRSIAASQLQFLETELNRSGVIENVFIFFHEVLWNSLERYSKVKSNSRSRYAQIKNHSNFWTDVYPLLEQHSDKNIYLISGDVAGNTDAIPAFYDQWNHISLISSGMGEVNDENYLQVKINERGVVQFKLHAVRAEDEIKPLEWYGLPNTPKEIRGETYITEANRICRYQCSEIENADSYQWFLPERAIGSSISKAIDIEFIGAFISDELKVVAAHEGYGTSDTARLSLDSNITGLNFDEVKMKIIDNMLLINSNQLGSALLEFIDVSGKVIQSVNLQFQANSYQNIKIPFEAQQIGFVRMTIQNKVKILKAYLR